MAEANHATVRKTGRLEAFSDAVLAIAFTLTATELKPPERGEPGTLAQGYADLGSQYGSFAISFGVIGLYWLLSHFDGKITRKTDHYFNLLTILFLASVCITPFPSRPFIEHLFRPEDQQTAALVYGSLLALPTILWWLRSAYASRAGLLDPRLTGDYVRRQTRRHGLMALAMVGGVFVIAAIDWRVGFAVVAAVVLSYLVPPPAPVYRPGCEPGDDADEAEDAE